MKQKTGKSMFMRRLGSQFNFKFTVFEKVESTNQTKPKGWEVPIFVSKSECHTMSFKGNYLWDLGHTNFETYPNIN